MSFSKKFGICLCILPASLGIIVIALNPGDLGNIIIGFFLLVLALILFIPGLIFFIVGIKKDKKKIGESEASESDASFQSFAESETDNLNKMEKKPKKEKIKKNKKKPSEQDFTFEGFD